MLEIDEKMYTISDVAKMTRLTDRTIRNYLANGTLKGSKVGGQWRFSKDDLKSFFNNNIFAEDMNDKAESIVNKYYENKIDFVDKNNVCIVLNFNSTNEKIKDLVRKIKSMETNDDVKERIFFIDNEKNRVKFVFVGPLHDAIKIFKIVEEVSL